MRADELHEHAAEGKRYVSDQSVFVPTEIKYDPVVAHEVDSSAELPLYVSWICPTRFGYDSEPSADRPLSPRVSRPEFLQRPPGDHLHTKSYHVTNLVSISRRARHRSRLACRRM